MHSPCGRNIVGPLSRTPGGSANARQSCAASSLGGDGSIVPGRVADARLALQITPALKGTLRSDLAVDGEVRAFTIPVRAASEVDHLRATLSASDN